MTKQVGDVDDTADWMLRRLAFFANQGLIELGITVQVGGMLVSGVLVSGRRYFQGVADQCRANNLELFAEIFEAPLEEVYSEPEPKETLDATSALPYYLHLMDARYFHTSGPPVPSNQGIWWRGRLREIAGFNLGTLGADQPPAAVR